MLSSYLKIAFRNILKTQTQSFINICGLAIGMAAYLLILHYINFEKSYDQFHEATDRIYRLRYERFDEKAKGVVLTSSGNFAQAFGYAGREMGVPICVVAFHRAVPSS